MARREEHRLDCFQRLEALIDSAGAGDVEEANALLRRFKGKSQAVDTAMDEFMLDFMTLVFVVETGEEGFEKPLRRLARTRLAILKHLVTVTA
ncbi:msr1816 [Mesorhizobium japonicum MAFF 303099]|uniref:Msr1816 protein n=1 Tax=Mesorhizobium japonicum (strain LMG 29417 / CECT 9101 / MAFF 303099) TaxID=266835 RepID=Q98JR6_RHILO|nr:msr1816 [Mesorhizobium japonicum MAFF 303099]